MFTFLFLNVSLNIIFFWGVRTFHHFSVTKEKKLFSMDIFCSTGSYFVLLLFLLTLCLQFLNLCLSCVKKKSNYHIQNRVYCLHHDLLWESLTWYIFLLDIVYGCLTKDTTRVVFHHLKMSNNGWHPVPLVWSQLHEVSLTMTHWNWLCHATILNGIVKYCAVLYSALYYLAV